ncbi:uncharacterized protein TNCV_755831 [Trichonephila clavipes]|nr:uncharacterized protein TNCV_755831 [Trichonephila clavipes]
MDHNDPPYICNGAFDVHGMAERLFMSRNGQNRPLKLVIKGLPEDVEPEDVKKDLISKGINVEKVAQLKKFATKARLPLFLIEITRDDSVNDIYQVRSVLYMQIKLDPFRKSNRVTQCYNCNNFHHASQNCFMKTRCLKCGENHRTGECSIKGKKCSKN